MFLQNKDYYCNQFVFVIMSNKLIPVRNKLEKHKIKSVCRYWPFWPILKNDSFQVEPGFDMLPNQPDPPILPHKRSCKMNTGIRTTGGSDS